MRSPSGANSTPVTQPINSPDLAMGAPSTFTRRRSLVDRAISTVRSPRRLSARTHTRATFSPERISSRSRAVRCERPVQQR